MNKTKGILSVEDIAAWYRAATSKYQGLADNITAAINSLLKTKGIDFLAVGARVKTLERVLEKFERKKYASFDDLTDMLGVRVIVYLESDVAAVCSVLESAFQVHPDLGADKSEELAVDQIGYRSVHYICDLGTKRVALDELAQYGGMRFEIQVRTILQHAWAEIEHDRSYKFPGDLPPALRRRLNLLAGTLELVDREFSTLAKDLDEYAKQTANLEPSKMPQTQELDALLVSRILDKEPYKANLVESGATPPLASTVDELVRFGVTDVAQLRALLSPEFLAEFKRNPIGTKVGILRRAMMFADVDKYFAQAWNRDWHGMSSSTSAMLNQKYGAEKMKEIHERYLRSGSRKRKATKGL